MKIIEASYAHIKSMYHGEGPKNVEALFYAAQAQNAILFIDEADSLLSRRLTNVNQGSEQAINSMRSQLLICLERFKGVVIFATNLVQNYDPAFRHPCSAC
jgi:SpoVK/Ycf46/Vps4 family AAA+-type ATPase